MVKAVRAVVALLLVLLGTVPARGAAATSEHHGGTWAGTLAETWAGTWEAAASGTAAPLPDTSVRNVVHTSIGGSAARVRLTNRLGTKPLRIGAVTVALQRPGPFAPGADAVSSTLRTATFHGARTVTVPPGRDVVTDPVHLYVPADSNLLVSVWTPRDCGPATYHRSARRTSYLAHGGNHTADPGSAAYTATTTSWYYVTGVDVRGAEASGSVVAFGDSLTDGVGSTHDADERWPDHLADRLAGLPPYRRLGVLNAGVSGNRLLADGIGPRALSRLDVDVFSRTGVRTVILWEGINDVKNARAKARTETRAGTRAEAKARLADLVRVYRTFADRAHAKGIRVIGATLTPYKGHRVWTKDGEALRRAVNTFIRRQEPFDAVVDFDAVVRDPARPERIRPAYDPGDHLHFNDAGMRALADAVDLAQVTGERRAGAPVPGLLVPNPH